MLRRKKEVILENAVLTRRSFLRLSMIAAGSAIATACQEALTPTIPVGTNTPVPSPTPAVKFNLPGENVDAWTWVKQVRVGVSEGECEKLILQVNGQEVEAQPEGESFSAEIQLGSGENQVTAVCTLPEGGEVASDSVIYTVRLRQSPTAVIHITLDGQVLLDGSQS